MAADNIWCALPTRIGSLGLRGRGSRGLVGLLGVGFSNRFGQNSMVMLISQETKNAGRRSVMERLPAL
jgi:hypothetical protein